MSKSIFKLTNKKISPTTLQRFFELITNTSKSSKYTLNVLSEFIGYYDWDDLQNKHKEEIPISKSNLLIPDEFGLNLLKVCLKNHHFDSALEYLLLLPSEGLDYHVEKEISRTFGRIIRKDSKAREYLLPRLAKTKQGRKLFYESYVDINFLNDYYSYALENFYIKNTSSINPKKQLDDFVFGQALIFNSSLEQKKYRKAATKAYEIFHKVPIETDVEEFNHPFPYSRLLTTYLIYYQSMGLLNLKKINVIINRFLKIPSKFSGDRIFCFAQLFSGLFKVRNYHLVVDCYKDNKSEILKDQHIFPEFGYYILRIAKESHLIVGLELDEHLKEISHIHLHDNISVSETITLI